MNARETAAVKPFPFRRAVLYTVLAGTAAWWLSARFVDISLELLFYDGTTGFF